VAETSTDTDPASGEVSTPTDSSGGSAGPTVIYSGLPGYPGGHRPAKQPYPLAGMKAVIETMPGFRTMPVSRRQRLKAGPRLRVQLHLSRAGRPPSRWLTVGWTSRRITRRPATLRSDRTNPARSVLKSPCELLNMTLHAAVVVTS